MNAEFNVDLNAQFIVVCGFLFIQSDLNLAKVKYSENTVEGNFGPFLQTYNTSNTYLSGKKSPTVHFGPGILFFIFLCYEAVLRSSLRRNIVCHGDCPRWDCTDIHILEVTEETIVAAMEAEIGKE